MLAACADNNQGQNADTDATTVASTKAKKRETVWDLFGNNNNVTNTQLQANKYLWQASIETLDFLPLEEADPFTGLLRFGWGRAPGGKTQYRATVQVSKPILDAGALNVAIQTRNGSATAQTTREVENAILSRARQIRIGDVRR